MSWSLTGLAQPPMVQAKGKGLLLIHADHTDQENRTIGKSEHQTPGIRRSGDPVIARDRVIGNPKLYHRRHKGTQRKTGVLVKGEAKSRVMQRSG